MLVAYIVVVYKRQMPIVICHEQMTFAILGCLIELVARKSKTGKYCTARRVELIYYGSTVHDHIIRERIK
jgi:hypothetical protein